MKGDTPTGILLALAGEVALLLWSTQLITAAVLRAFGSRLKHVLGSGLDSRWRAFLAGLAVTAGLQSSTATAMMIASFTMAGTIALMPALAMMLGANVGTTLIVLFFSFDMAVLTPLLLLAGFVLSKRAQGLVASEMGRAVFGLGLMLLALKLLQATMAPVEHSALLHANLAALSRDPLVALLAAAVLAWAAHSSVAAVLLVMSLAAAGVVQGPAMLAMVMGCNIGSALNPLIQAWGGDDVSRRLPVGNLINRLVGSALGMALLPWLAELPTALGLGAASAVGLAHLAFNLAMALLALPLLPLLARLLTRLFPDAEPGADPAQPLYLDQEALTTPTVALANATREVLRMADVVETMLRNSEAAFASDDVRKVAATASADDVIDSLFNQIQLYVGAIDQAQLKPKDEKRLLALLTLAINLEHIGDIVEKSLMQMAGKRIREHRRLTPAQIQRISDMHQKLCEHLRLAVSVFITKDETTARRLILEKETFRDLEQAAVERQLAEMRTGRAEAIMTSALELDITRDLKRIDAHIASTVHGLLERRGVLQASRLIQAAS